VATSATEPEILPFFVLNQAFLGAVYRPPADAFQVPEYSGNLRVVSRRFVSGAHAHNVAVHVWTVNETEDMERFIELGVDGIITDRPDRLMRLLGR
jgi:glycerophosphoryl diester phosphodiesterase